MNSQTEKPMAFGNFDSHFDNGGAMPPMDSVEELEWLMSLALDDALDEGEAARLDLLLAQEPAHAERWVAWQAVDADFHQVPFVLPPVDFGAKFEQRLALVERQRRLRTGMIFGLAAVVLWVSALGGTLAIGALMWSNQNLWVGGLIHNFAYWWAALGQFVQVLVDTGVALWSAPQTRALLLCYLAGAAGILVGWVFFLRRSLRVIPLVEA